MGHFGQVHVRTVHERDTCAERRQARACHLQRIPVTIEGQQTSIGGGRLENTGSVSPGSHRGVYVVATGPDLQAIQHLLEKNRDMNRNASFLALNAVWSTRQPPFGRPLDLDRFQFLKVEIGLLGIGALTCPLLGVPDLDVGARTSNDDIPIESGVLA